MVVDQGEAPRGRLWDVPGLPRARQGAGGAGIIALEADGGHEREAPVRVQTAASHPLGGPVGRDLGL